MLGGTRFVGRHIAEAFLQAGHTVTVFNRGKTADELPKSVKHLLGDRNDGAAGLSALEQHSWDACIDVSGYTPRQVRASAEALKGRVGRYVLISTGSVYAEQGRHPICEDDPLLPAAAEDVTEVTGELYGPLKVACEQIVQQIYGDQCTILRPQIIAGPYDYTLRYPYWVDRAARGGTVLAGQPEDHFQVIDARDLARFAVKVVQDDIPGIFNLSGPRLTWREFLQALGAQDVHWTTPEQLEKAGATIYDLPIYLPDNNEQAGLMDMDNARALAAGLTLTDAAQTARDTRAWSERANLSYALTPEREAEILRVVGTP